MKKRSTHQGHLDLPSRSEKKAAFRFVCRDFQLKLLEIKNTWWSNLVEGSQLYIGDASGFYEILEVVYVLTYQVHSSMFSVGTQALLTELTSIPSRWSENFQAPYKNKRKSLTLSITKKLLCSLSQEKSSKGFR